MPGARPAFEQAPDGEDRKRRLARTIEAEIIPRLMLAHRPAPLAVPEGRASATCVPEFLALVMKPEAEEVKTFVEGLRTDGWSLEMLYLDLMAPTARKLGELWEADLCDFTEVTIGLGRLHNVLLELSMTFRADSTPWSRGRKALLVPAPGEQHTLGLSMVAEFFRRSGWEVHGDKAGARCSVADMVRNEWFDLVGFSAGSDCRIESVAAEILAIRRASKNPAIAVMVGGPIFLAHPEMVAQVGADAMAIDAPDAVLQAEALLGICARRSM